MKKSKVGVSITLMRKHRDTINWQRFIIHFIFGVVIGAIAGYGFWLCDFDASIPLSVCILGGALIFGLLGAVLGDEFWESLVDRWR